jgi:hypothetical protein
MGDEAVERREYCPQEVKASTPTTAKCQMLVVMVLATYRDTTQYCTI